MSDNAYPCFLGHTNRLLDAAPSATDTAATYDVANVTDLKEFTWWQAASAGTKYITVNCGEAKAADSLGIVGHNLNTATATVSVEWSANGADWTEVLAGFIPATDFAIFKTWTSVSKQYWRIKIVTGAIAARIAIAIIGPRFDFPVLPAGGFDPDAEEILAESATSKTGYALGSVVRFYPRTFSMQFNRVTQAWVSDTFKPVYVSHLSLLKPVLVVWDRTNHATEVFFGQLPANHRLAMPYDPFRRSLRLEFVGRREI